MWTSFTVFQYISDELWAEQTAQNKWMPSTLHNTISSCISWCSGGLCWVTWFSEVLLSPSGYVHHGISNNIAWGLDGHVHSEVVSALGLYAPRFPWLNLFTILWTVDGEMTENYFQSCAEKHCLWTDWQFSHKVWHKVVNHILACKD